MIIKKLGGSFSTGAGSPIAALMEDIKHPTGISGGTGSTGITGGSGATGISGASGATSISGASGATGISGASGATGNTIQKRTKRAKADLIVKEVALNNNLKKLAELKERASEEETPELTAAFKAQQNVVARDERAMQEDIKEYCQGTCISGGARCNTRGIVICTKCYSKYRW